MKQMALGAIRAHDHFALHGLVRACLDSALEAVLGTRGGGGLGSLLL
jgi:hypothetical protein